MKEGRRGAKGEKNQGRKRGSEIERGVKGEPGDDGREEVGSKQRRIE